MSSPHVWILVGMFIIGIIFHYPQQILQIDSPSLLSFWGLSRHGVERVFFLIPVIYAGYIFSLRIGLATLVLSLAIIIPRIVILSEYKADAILESIVVFIVGLLVNLWTEAYQKRGTQSQQLISKLEESERRMSVSEQKYRYLFEHASDAIWVQDVNGFFVDGNRAWEKMTGFTREEVRGIHLARFLSEDSLALARDVRNKLINGEEFEQPYEQHFYIKGGAIRTVKMSTNAVVSGGRITGFEHVARDVTEEKVQEENVRAYLQQITRTQEEERKRIARDLHDDVSPDIIILIQKLDNLVSAQRMKLATLRDNLEDVREQAVNALESLRATAQGLRPRIIDDLGLVAALEWIAEGLERDQKIQANVETKNMEAPLSPEAQILLFRIAQEALNNTRKHAKASKVNIRLESKDDNVLMTVTDNGQGFEAPGKIEGMVSAGRLGLMGMHERARLLNGTLQINSAPGKGTEILVNIPRPIAK
ncbi:MAG: PAS domain S-box protein [Dehalococcoidales bacterium]|nr:PAS domain S-box protein [Dehalococcoidales bacterium]